MDDGILNYAKNNNEERELTFSRWRPASRGANSS